MRIAAVTVLLLVIALFGCGDDDDPVKPPETGSVKGSIVLLPSGSPVTDARVLLVDPYQLTPASPLTGTDHNGRYQIDQVPPGSYSVFVYHDSLFTFDRTAPLVWVSANNVSTHQVRLVRNEFWDNPEYRIAGTVIDAETGDPIEGAFVEGLFWAAHVDLPFRGVLGPWFGVSDSLGRFSIRVSAISDVGELLYGLEPISVSKAGYDPKTLCGDGEQFDPQLPPALPFPPDDETTLNVQLGLFPLDAQGNGQHGIGTLRGRVTCLGRPVGFLSVAVSLFASANPDTHRLTPLAAAVPIPERYAFTNEDGVFTIDRLTPGSYVVHPAYLDGDGYLYMPHQSYIHEVVLSGTTDAGDIPILPAIKPNLPHDKSIIQNRRPLFTWDARPDTSSYTFHGYRLEICVGSTTWATIRDLTEPRWQMPAELAFDAGSLIRWTVDVMGTPHTQTYPIVMARFEHDATVTVSP